MDALRLHRVIEKDGELTVTDLPYKQGQQVEVIVLTETPEALRSSRLTARRLLSGGLIGLWQDRQDIGESGTYARHLRDAAQRRPR